MRVPRIYTSTALQEHASIQLPTEAAHRVQRVLRLKPGAEIVVFNGDGRDYRATLTPRAGPGLWLEVHDKTDAVREPSLTLRVLQGIGKSEHMDLALQKAVELGAVEMIPVFCERTVVRLSGPRMGQRMEHWRRVVIAACEQSGRARIPQLAAPRQLLQLCDDPPDGLNLVLHPRGTKSLLQLSRPERVSILTGPEGGLTQAELDAAESAGFLSLRLGPRILRTETAPLAAIAAIQALWGDFRG